MLYAAEWVDRFKHAVWHHLRPFWCLYPLPMRIQHRIIADRPTRFAYYADVSFHVVQLSGFCSTTVGQSIVGGIALIMFQNSSQSIFRTPLPSNTIVQFDRPRFGASKLPCCTHASPSKIRYWSTHGRVRN